MDTAQSTSGPAQHVARPAVPVDQHLPAGHAKGHVCTALLGPRPPAASRPAPAGSISPSLSTTRGRPLGRLLVCRHLGSLGVTAASSPGGAEGTVGPPAQGASLGAARSWERLSRGLEPLLTAREMAGGPRFRPEASGRGVGARDLLQMEGLKRLLLHGQRKSASAWSSSTPRGQAQSVFVAASLWAQCHSWNHSSHAKDSGSAVRRVLAPRTEARAAVVRRSIRPRSGSRSDKPTTVATRVVFRQYFSECHAQVFLRVMQVRQPRGLGGVPGIKTGCFMGEDHAVVVCCPGENLTCGLNRVEQLVSADGALAFWHLLAQSCSPFLVQYWETPTRHRCRPPTRVTSRTYGWHDERPSW